MKYRKLGKSDLKVSSVCMGCMGFGDSNNGQHSWTIDEEHTREIIKKGLDNGINFFDTAIGYQNGTSEQYVGRSLRDFGDRDDYVIATKFLPRNQYELDNNISGQEHVKNNANQSLENLGLDYIDLYIYHMWDYHTPMEEIMEGLHSLVEEGKVRYIGISNCFAWQLAKANYYARENDLTEFVSLQSHYNLIAREDEREIVPFTKDAGIALTPYSALASGRLSRLPNETSKRLKEDEYAKFKYDQTAESDSLIIKRVFELASDKGLSMTEISLAWLLGKVTSPVVGATKPHHLDGLINSVNVNLSSKEIEYLEELYVPHPLVGVMAQNGTQKSGNVV